MSNLTLSTATYVPVYIHRSLCTELLGFGTLFDVLVERGAENTDTFVGTIYKRLLATQVYGCTYVDTGSIVAHIMCVYSS